MAIAGQTGAETAPRVLYLGLQASSHCGFGSDPPRKSVWPGCEIILPSHCVCSATVPDVRALPSPLPGCVDGSWWPQGPQGRIQPVATPHPREWGLAWSLEQGKVSHIPAVGHCRQAGSIPLTLELTGFVGGVVGDGHD